MQKGPVWGNTVAGPIFHEVAEQTARILDLKPDKVPAQTQKMLISIGRYNNEIR